MKEAIGNDAFWEPLDHTHRLGARTPPVSFISGWYDFMLDQLLRDYPRWSTPATRRTSPSGRGPRRRGPAVESVSETLTGCAPSCSATPPACASKPVRLHISGLDEWRDFDSYPPGSAEQPDLAHPSRQRAVAATRSGPRSPTPTPTIRPTRRPTVGGAMFAFTGAGPVDNARSKSATTCWSTPPSRCSAR